MSPHQNLILLGLAAVESMPDTHDRIAHLEAAADLLEDPELSERCRVTASCLREADGAQLRLFRSLRPQSTR